MKEMVITAIVHLELPDQRGQGEHGQGEQHDRHGQHGGDGDLLVFVEGQAAAGDEAGDVKDPLAFYPALFHAAGEINIANCLHGWYPGRFSQRYGCRQQNAEHAGRGHSGDDREVKVKDKVRSQ